MTVRSGKKKAWKGAEIWALDRIKPHPKNPRVHPVEQIAALTKVLVASGPDQPIVVDEDGVIIKGHGRLLAAYEAGLVEFPVFVRTGLSEAEKTAIRIADNQIALLSTWDEDLLRADLNQLSLAGYEMPLLGFGHEELIEYMADPPLENADPDKTPPPPTNPVSKTGDLWVLGNHRLLCGDSTKAEDVARALDGAKPKLMVTDPPYGVAYDPSWRAKRGVNKSKGKLGTVLNDDRADWTDAWRLFEGSVAYVWCASMTNDVVIAGLEITKLIRRAQIMWSKDRFTLGRGDYHWQHEVCWYVVREGKAGCWAGDRKQSTVWSIPARDDAGHGHGTQKPVECMRRPIQNNSKPGDVVYEPFSGSGTTIIAAELMKRHCRAIELSPAYVDVAVKRWQEYTGKAATLDGRTFAQVAKDRGNQMEAANEAGDTGKPIRGARVAADAANPKVAKHPVRTAVRKGQPREG